MPASATAHRPELAGRCYEALGVSIVIHPQNPYVPTTHCNVRLFIARHPEKPPIWWFGGGFDLTPYYGFDEDCILWHQYARKACLPFGAEVYPNYKKWCDDYFYLKHRQEPRGIGGIFYDDLNHFDFATCFQFHQAVAENFLQAYHAIFMRRIDTLFTERERQHQLLRRGRYVEFNLVFDRGTLFGLQSGGRTESILMSLPARVEWRYNHVCPAGTPEAKLLDYYLKPRDWLAT